MDVLLAIGLLVLFASLWRWSHTNSSPLVRALRSPASASTLGLCAFLLLWLASIVFPGLFSADRLRQGEASLVSVLNTLYSWISWPVWLLLWVVAVLLLVAWHRPHSRAVTEFSRIRSYGSWLVCFLLGASTFSLFQQPAVSRVAFGGLHANETALAEARARLGIALRRHAEAVAREAVAEAYRQEITRASDEELAHLQGTLEGIKASAYGEAVGQLRWLVCGIPWSGPDLTREFGLREAVRVLPTSTVASICGEYTQAGGIFGPGIGDLFRSADQLAEAAARAQAASAFGEAAGMPPEPENPLDAWAASMSRFGDPPSSRADWSRQYSRILDLEAAVESVVSADRRAKEGEEALALLLGEVADLTADFGLVGAFAGEFIDLGARKVLSVISQRDRNISGAVTDAEDISLRLRDAIKDAGISRVIFALGSRDSPSATQSKAAEVSAPSEQAADRLILSKRLRRMADPSERPPARPELEEIQSRARERVHFQFDGNRRRLPYYRPSVRRMVR